MLVSNTVQQLVETQIHDTVPNYIYVVYTTLQAMQRCVFLHIVNNGIKIVDSQWQLLQQLLSRLHRFCCNLQTVRLSGDYAVLGVWGVP